MKDKILTLLETKSKANIIIAIELARTNDIDILDWFEEQIKFRYYDFSSVNLSGGIIQSNVPVSPIVYNKQISVSDLVLFIYCIDMTSSIYDQFKNEPVAYETLTEVLVGDLSDFIDQSTTNGKLTAWNYRAIITEFPEIQEKYNKIKRRLAKKLLAFYSTVELPLEFEFLEVDEETDFYGNDSMTGKEYCKIKLHCTEKWSPIETLKVELLLLSNLSKGEPLTPKQEETKIQDILKEYQDKLNYEKPFVVNVSGNDDYALSKTFWTEEEAKEEIRFLMTIQPINGEVDLIQRDYLTD